MIKICGIRDQATVPVLNRIHPDMVGFVFANSSRQVTLSEACLLRQALDPQIQTVGVFVNAPLLAMVKAFQTGAISVVQLHGQEDQSTVDQLQAMGIKVIEVRHQINDCRKSQAEMILYDGGAGTMTRLDWQPLPQLRQARLLAGGLTPENVCQAIALTQADGVDVSSGVESGGSKDPTKLRSFVTAVRRMGK